MTRRLKRIGPLKFGIVAGIMQALISLIIIPFFLVIMVAANFSPHAHSDLFPALGGLVGGIFACIMIPIFYAVFGFIFGCLGALVYNLVAKLMGGIEFEVE